MTPPLAWTGLRLELPAPDSQIDEAIAGVCVWDHKRTAVDVRGNVFATFSGQERGLVAY
jgi:hypothetical protein